jgi:hypothetical protein
MTCVTLSVIDGGYGRVARRESEICSVWRSLAMVVSKGGHVSSSRRKPGGHGLCDIGGATNGGGSGGVLRRRDMYCTIVLMYRTMVLLACLTKVRC